ncbi:CTRB [Mytilus edulis]|uniref:CTRB n=1 Tax=Mytilus edulis TaxID=6550 RepID=A0A8S3RJN6_MYTED|nr:CTRB [Mytilus edulis]
MYTNETRTSQAFSAIPKVVFGLDAYIRNHPWMVSVQFREDENESFTHNCGGAIIDKSWILTAAHCNSLNSDRPYPCIVCNIFEKSNVEVATIVYTMPRHEQFGLARDGRPINDIMLLQLHTPLKFRSTINKIDLDTDIRKNYTGKWCTITGWGDTDANLGKKYPDRLQVLRMPVVTQEHCGTAWRIPRTFWNKLICLQVKNKDSCKHDSGGPVVCSKKLVGTLTTGGVPCDGSKPSIHTRISAYLDWIKDKMNTKMIRIRKTKNKENMKGEGTENLKNNRDQNCNYSKVK